MTPKERIRCVHCGRVLEKVTRDHVFPKSWYPASTPSEVRRWTVPSCAQCNNRLGNLERELFVRLALCVDPRKAEVSGLSAKAVRSMGVGAEGISFGERVRRKALKRRVIKSMRRYKVGMETFPGLGPHPEFPESEQFALTFSADQIVDVARKIVRGCEYVLADRIVDEPYVLETYFVKESDVADQTAHVFESLSAKTTHLGPGFIITRSEALDQPGMAMYKIVMWGTIIIYASITRSDDPVNARRPRPQSTTASESDDANPFSAKPEQSFSKAARKALPKDP